MSGRKLNVEIKARTVDPHSVRRKLRTRGARYEGLDRQIDTYFKVARGRLKLRQGNIENSLIHYERPDDPSLRRSDVVLYRTAAASMLHNVLTASLDVDVVVEKHRHIYFLDNVKVHVDFVPSLGHFVEIEAIDEEGSFSEAHLRGQCRALMTALGVEERDLVAESYSDLLRELRSAPIWAHYNALYGLLGAVFLGFGGPA